MKLPIQKLWSFKGEIARGPFLAWSLALFAVKYNLDRLVMLTAFDHSWSVFSYFDQPMPGMQLLSPAQNVKEFIALLALSLPFFWAGVALCLQRLRSARLPLWLVILFVAPIIKWFLFVLLAIIPERVETPEKPPRLRRWLPDSKWGCAALAAAASAVFVTSMVIISTVLLGQYGWALFIGAPFATGFLSAIIYQTDRPRKLSESFVVACASITLTGVALLAIAAEGAICLIMAAPLAYALACLGALAGHCASNRSNPEASAQLLCIPLLAMPLMMATEAMRPYAPPLFKVVTSVEVDAPVEVVWKHVVEFSELPPPKELIFRAGIAYPLRAEIRGQGVGAVRHCVFSTGPFVEPIDVWDEPRLLAFSVTSNPAPLEEWTPYHHIHPAHLDGFMTSEKGQFHLMRLPGNRTLLEGTTWYHHGLWPASYWRIWSDQIIHTIHRRVLLHVKQLAEGDDRRG